MIIFYLDLELSISKSSNFSGQDSYKKSHNDYFIAMLLHSIANGNPLLNREDFFL